MAVVPTQYAPGWSRRMLHRALFALLLAGVAAGLVTQVVPRPERIPLSEPRIVESAGTDIEAVRAQAYVASTLTLARPDIEAVRAMTYAAPAVTAEIVDIEAVRAQAGFGSTVAPERVDIEAVRATSWAG